CLPPLLSCRRKPASIFTDPCLWIPAFAGMTLRGASNSRDGTPALGAEGSTRPVIAWCLFDWANSAFPAIVTTFLFSAYFTDHVAPTHAAGQALWSFANGAAALFIALVSPLLGAIVDQGGRRKPWLLAFSLVNVVATAALWFVRPTADDML